MPGVDPTAAMRFARLERKKTPNVQLQKLMAAVQGVKVNPTGSVSQNDRVTRTVKVISRFFRLRAAFMRQTCTFELPS
jgi:hypothetical protein